ncbi:hypothetical protein D4764_22G0005310 [Takifugu flavidus]|uniref:Uncharacterized protein n=1 Tax=Takifugu flavidus TaxID=433684 RepID=A0A5C6NBQ7_9TELE|nr:hypothetical protein D4764_22G0005310 [Takifugu flavidus]
MRSTNFLVLTFYGTLKKTTPLAENSRSSCCHKSIEENPRELWQQMNDHRLVQLSEDAKPQSALCAQWDPGNTAGPGLVKAGSTPNTLAVRACFQPYKRTRQVGTVDFLFTCRLFVSSKSHQELSSRYAPILKKVRGHLVLEPEGEAGAHTWCVLCKECVFVGVKVSGGVKVRQMALTVGIQYGRPRASRELQKHA